MFALKYAQHVDHKGVYMYMLSCSSELTEYYTGSWGGGGGGGSVCVGGGGVIHQSG